MNALDRFRLWVARGAYKAAGLTFLPQWVRYSVFSPAWQMLLSEGYKANSAVFACAEALGFAFQEPPLLAWREAKSGLEPILNHPFRKLMMKPNADMGRAEFQLICVLYAAIGGNCYIWKQRSAGKRVVGLWPLNDGQMQPIAGHNTEQGFVSYYELATGSDSPLPIPKEDVIHWKWMPDLQYPWRGMGAVAAAARDVDTDNEVGSYIFSLLKNDAVPRVVVTLVEGEELTPARSKRLKEEWVQKYGGDNRGAPAFLEAGMKAEKMSFDLTQMAFEALRGVPEARIAACFRVPPIIAGLNIGLNRSTFSNYKEARQAFAEDTLVPLWASFASEVQQGLADEPGFSDAIYRHDLNQVRALQENQTELWNRANSSFNNNLTTRAESRRMVGLPSSPTDEVYKETLTMVLTPAGQLPVPRTAENGTAPKLLPRVQLKQNGRTRAMVALMLPQEIGVALQAIVGQLPSGSTPVPIEEMHLTLCYLGDTETLTISPEAITAVLAQFSAEWGPMAGVLNGVGLFNVVQEDGALPLYASFDAPRLPAFRQALVDKLTQAGIVFAGEHGFVPHITVAYVPAGTELPADMPRTSFVFSAVTLAWGDARADYPLHGAKQAERKETRKERRKELVEARRRVRASVVGRAEAAIDSWFAGLADRVMSRARKGWGARGERKELPAARELLTTQDTAELTGVIQRFYAEILFASWEYLNLELGETVSFSENDPIVTQLLGEAGVRIQDIHETTLQSLQELLQDAYANGWSVDDLVEHGLRDLIEETYRNRARTIARTEIGTAQNNGTVLRYGRAGVKFVEVFDNGFDNSDPECKRLAGTIQTLEWARANPLQHPNCVRAFGAVFD